MKPSDLSRIVSPSDPRVSGDRIAYVRTRIDLNDDRYVSEIWIHDSYGHHRLTAGPSDSAPRWSPDGLRLAFLRSRDAKPAQVAVMAVDGGEAEVVTDFALGVEALHWSPDGSRIAVVAITFTPEWDGLDDDERSRRPRRISSVPYRFDGKGWTHDRRRHLWLVDPLGSVEPDCLTPGDYDETDMAWSADGARIAFISDRDPARGLDSGNEVYEIEVDGDRLPVKAVARGAWLAPTYRPDGVLHLVGCRQAGWPFTSRIYRREADGTLVDLSAHLDRSVTSLVSGPPHFVWVDDVVYTIVEDAGKVGVIAIHPNASTATFVDGERSVSGFDVDSSRLVFVCSEARSTGELYELSEGERRLTELGVDLDLVEPVHFRVDSDGVEVDVWVYLPAGDGQVPVLVNIHGGPASQYGFGFFDEFQAYVGAGFGVVACNPRGSSGRGDEFMKAVVGDGWGVADVADVSRALDVALQRFPRLDPERLGIMGGSYGGFLTAWMTARSDRFGSAVVERALLSWPSFAGTSDIAGGFPPDYTGAQYPDAWGVWWEKSPLATAHLVATPTLVLHAEADFRCPIEQAEQYFMALLRNGVPAEFLRFPAEGHEMSRTGKPRHRLQRLEAVIEWHTRWLGSEA